MGTVKTSFHTGPTLVKAIADKFRDAGIRVYCEGTERVYVEVEVEGIGTDSEARENAVDALFRTHGTRFGLS